MLLSMVEISYQVIQTTCPDLDLGLQKDVELDQYPFPNRPFLHPFLMTYYTLYYLQIRPSWSSQPQDKGLGRICIIIHIFFPNIERMEKYIEILVSIDIVKWPQSPIMIHDVIFKGNLGNISNTIPINILVKPGVVENILIGAYYSP